MTCVKKDNWRIVYCLQIHQKINTHIATNRIFWAATTRRLHRRDQNQLQP